MANPEPEQMNEVNPTSEVINPALQNYADDEWVIEDPDNWDDEDADEDDLDHESEITDQAPVPKLTLVTNKEQQQLEHYISSLDSYIAKIRNGIDVSKIVDDIVTLIAKIQYYNPVTASTQISRLVYEDKNGKGILKLRDLKRAVNMRQKDVQRQHDVEKRLHRITVKKVWFDAPEEYHDVVLALDYEYEPKTGHIIATIVGKEGISRIVISRQPTFIAGFAENFVSRETKVTIMTRDSSGEWVTYDMCPSDFMDSGKVSKLADYGGSVIDAREMGKYLMQSFEDFRHVNKRRPEIITSRLGWHPWQETGECTFVFPYTKGNIRFINDITTKTEIESLSEAKGNIAKEQKYLCQAIMNWSKVATLIGTAAAASLVRLAKASEAIDLFSFVVEIVSDQTSVGKSTALSIAYAPWGSPKSVRTFNGTNFGMSKMIEILSDIPVLFQEAQAGERGRGNSIDVESFLHAIADGGGKIQGSQAGGLRHNPHLYTTIIMANNVKLLLDDANQGAKQRVITLSPPIPYGDPAVVDEIKQGLASNHGHAAYHYVNGIMSIGQWDDMLRFVNENVIAESKWFLDCVDKRIKPLTPLYAILVRRAKLFGVIALGFRLMMQFGYRLDIDNEIVQRGMQGIYETFEVDVIGSEVADQDDNVEWKRCLGIVRENIQRNITQVHHYEQYRDGQRIAPMNGYIGTANMIQGEWHVCIGRLQVEKWLRDHGKSINTMSKAWVREKVLTPGGDKKNTRNIEYRNIGNNQIQRGRLLCFKLGAIGLEEPKDVEK